MKLACKDPCCTVDRLYSGLMQVVMLWALPRFEEPSMAPILDELSKLLACPDRVTLLEKLKDHEALCMIGEGDDVRLTRSRA